MISAYGMIANGGVLMPRHTILKVSTTREAGLAARRDLKITGERVVTRQAAYIMTDIMAGNTIRSPSTRSGASGRSPTASTGVQGPPGRVQDRHDERQQGRPRLRLPRAAQGRAARARRRRLDGQLRQHAQRRQAVARHVGAAVVGDPVGRLQGPADRPLQPHQAQGPRHGGPSTRSPASSRTARPGARSRSCSSTAPSRQGRETRSTDVDIDAASGLRWQEGCVGPMVTKAYVDYSKVEGGPKAGRRPTAGWQARASRGSGVTGGPGSARARPTSTAAASTRSAARWGGSGSPPSKKCPLAPPEPTPCVPDFFNPLPAAEPLEPQRNRRRAAAATAGSESRPSRSASAARRPRAGRSSPRRRPRRARRRGRLFTSGSRPPAPGRRPAARPCRGRG